MLSIVFKCARLLSVLSLLVYFGVFMIEEKSCGIILFRDTGSGRFYLLLNYIEGHWDFPKGHVEKGEDELQTALRETQEETGIAAVNMLPEFRESLDYSYLRASKKFHKTVYFFIARTEEEKVRLSDEHTGSVWLPYKTAHKKLTFENAKKILEKAEAFLSNRANK
jgi:8-oxo-dGTP pyrophosphatase MutT (NUDIX family)